MHIDFASGKQPVLAHNADVTPESLNERLQMFEHLMSHHRLLPQHDLIATQIEVGLEATTQEKKIYL